MQISAVIWILLLAKRTSLRYPCTQYLLVKSNEIHLKGDHVVYANYWASTNGVENVADIAEPIITLEKETSLHLGI